MPAVSSYAELDSSVRDRRDPCPAEERVESWYDVPDAYAPGTKRGREGEVVGEDGIHYQKCGGGRRIVKKKIGGG